MWRSPLLLETPEAVRIGGKNAREYLDRDFAIQPGVTGAVDFAHPAGAERRANRAVVESGIRRQCHYRLTCSGK